MLIYDEDEFIDKWNYKYYAKFLLNVENLWEYDNKNLRSFITFLRDYRWRIQDRLDLTLKAKCISYCKRNYIEIPWFINQF